MISFFVRSSLRSGRTAGWLAMESRQEQLRSYGACSHLEHAFHVAIVHVAFVFLGLSPDCNNWKFVSLSLTSALLRT